MQKTGTILMSLIAGCLGGLFVLVFLSADNSGYNGQNTSSNSQIINIQNLENTVTSLAQDVSLSVVSIVIKKDLPTFRRNPFGFFGGSISSVETEVGGGTGFFVDTNGTIITNKHVVRDASANYSVVLNNGQTYDAQVLGLDPVNDLAIIKIEYDSIPLTLLSKSEQINIGQFVIAVGNALSEFQNSVSFGVVSGKDRVIQAQGESLSSLIQTDTAINPGNSGGPLINMAGDVIGINTAIASGQGLGFAISITQEKIEYMLDSIEQYGEIKKPFIGIYYIPINPVIATELDIDYDYGIYIPNEESAVLGESAASRAGIKPGDVILSIDNKNITEEFTLDILLQNKFPGEKLMLEILRDSEIKEVILELGKD